jgi:hypothetical protein
MPLSIQRCYCGWKIGLKEIVYNYTRGKKWLMGAKMKSKKIITNVVLDYNYYKLCHLKCTHRIEVEDKTTNFVIIYIEDKKCTSISLTLNIIF